MALTQVSSKGIKDATLLNEDINASAAIQGSKISPDFGSQNVVTTGNLTIGDSIIHSGDTDTKIRFSADGQVLFEIDGNDKLRLNDTGYIQAYDHIVPNNDSTKDLGLTGTRFRAAYVDTYYGDGSNLTGISSTTINNQADNRIITATGTTDTLNAESVLTFDGSTDTLQIHQQNSGNNPALKVIHRGGANSNISAHFQTYGGTNDVVITHGGQLGIGLTSPSQKLHLKDTAPMAQIESSSYSSFVGTAEANDNIGNGTKAGNLVLRGQTGIAISGNNGTAVQVKIDSDGLKFGTDTAAANALDDYEEGTFTPEYNSGSAASACFAGGVSYNSDKTGIYRKIGNMVYFFIKIQATSGTAKSGQLIINGLPFTSGDFSSNATAGGGLITLTTAFNNNSDMPTVFVGGTSSQIKFFFTNAGDFAGTNLPSPTGVIHLCGQYPTT